MHNFVRKIFKGLLVIELVFLSLIFAILGARVIVLKINWTGLDGLDWVVLGLMIILAGITVSDGIQAAKQKANPGNLEQA